MARVGGSVHHCPSCSMGHSEPSPPKLSSVCPEALLGRHRAGSSERGLLEQIVSPHVSNFTQSVGLRSVGFHHSLCCIYKLIMGNASRRYIVPVRRPEPRCPSLVWAAKVSDKLLCFSAPPQCCFHGIVLSRPQPATESQLWGPVFRPPPPDRRQDAEHCTVRTHWGHFSQVAQIVPIKQ